MKEKRCEVCKASTARNLTKKRIMEIKSHIKERKQKARAHKTSNESADCFCDTDVDFSQLSHKRG